MAAKSKLATFASERELCAAFIAALPKRYTAYPESCGFDIVLVRDDGVQIGIEAKLKLNAKVLSQVLPRRYDSDGPDFRAVLVPAGGDDRPMSEIAHALGITVIRAIHPGAPYFQAGYGFHPDLPEARRGDWYDEDRWADQCPPKRLRLPEYVPDVHAGVASPRMLSDWKIKAIKIVVLMKKRGRVTMAYFAHIRIDRRLWLDRGWIIKSEIRGVYLPGQPPDFEAMHPTNYAQIEADFEKWAPPEQLTI